MSGQTLVEVLAKHSGSHDDYARPLDVEWLCRVCHKAKDVPPATECKHGHPFDAENTYISPVTGRRQCRTCRRERGQRRSGDWSRRTFICDICGAVRSRSKRKRHLRVMHGEEAS